VKESEKSDEKQGLSLDQRGAYIAVVDDDDDDSNSSDEGTYPSLSCFSSHSVDCTV